MVHYIIEDLHSLEIMCYTISKVARPRERNLIITVPKGKEKWIATFGGGAFKRATATSMYNFAERKLLQTLKKKRNSASQEGAKTYVKVRYSDGDYNQSSTSNDPHYLLFTLACFLEDYLKPELLVKKYKKYKQE